MKVRLINASRVFPLLPPLGGSRCRQSTFVYSLPIDPGDFYNLIIPLFKILSIIPVYFLLYLFILFHASLYETFMSYLSLQFCFTLSFIYIFIPSLKETILKSGSILPFLSRIFILSEPYELQLLSSILPFLSHIFIPDIFLTYFI